MKVSHYLEKARFRKLYRENRRLKERLKRAKQDIEEFKMLYLKSVQDLETYKKLRQKELELYREYANEPLLKELIPILDHLELAIKVGGDNAEALKKGVEMVLRDFLRVLEKFGVKRIESEGKEFDPQFHEAIEVIETEEHPDGHIVKEHQAGYLLKGKLVRPARVSVAKRKKKEG